MDLDKIATEISDHIATGNFEKAKAVWGRVKADLSAYELGQLRDKLKLKS